MAAPMPPARRAVAAIFVISLEGELMVVGCGGGRGCQG
jgi:hypothetical protein